MTAEIKVGNIVNVQGFEGKFEVMLITKSTIRVANKNGLILDKVSKNKITVTKCISL